MASTPTQSDRRSGLPVVLTTREAAAALGYKANTLQKWACCGGPLTPVRIGRRLGWRLDEIQKMLTTPAYAGQKVAA